MDKSSFYQKMLDNLYEGVYFVDPDRKISFWNQGAVRITGFTAEEVVGKFCYNNILNHVDEQGNQLCFIGCPLEATIADGQLREAKVYLHHKNGHRVPVIVRAMAIYEDEVIIGAVETFSDITETTLVMQSLEEFKTLAMVDQLTQISNRRHLDAFVASKFNEYRVLGLGFGLIFFDIDHFKNINDTYGHDCGDAVLKMVANTCLGITRSTDLLGRFGGEEFVAVLVGLDQERLIRKAHELRMLVESSSLVWKDQKIQVTISLGVTMVKPEDDYNQLISRVDGLMYQSKRHGRNQVTTDGLE